MVALYCLPSTRSRSCCRTISRYAAQLSTSVLQLLEPSEVRHCDLIPFEPHSKRRKERTRAVVTDSCSAARMTHRISLSFSLSVIHARTHTDKQCPRDGRQPSNGTSLTSLSRQIWLQQPRVQKLLAYIKCLHLPPVCHLLRTAVF